MSSKPIDESVRVNATFSMVVKIKKGTDVATLLKAETEFLAEPKTANGLVVAMNLQNIEVIK